MSDQHSQSPYPRPNPLAIRFGRILFTRYPEWRKYKVAPDLRWQKPDDLAVEVPSRFAPHAPLRIETYFGGIIVSWGAWHVHCDEFDPGYEEEHKFIALALEIIADIINEKTVIYDHWRDGETGASGGVKPEELDKWLNMPSSRPDDKTTVRSWKGTYDRGEFDPAKL